MSSASGSATATSGCTGSATCAAVDSIVATVGVSGKAVLAGTGVSSAGNGTINAGTASSSTPCATNGEETSGVKGVILR